MESVVNESKGNVKLVSYSRFDGNEGIDTIEDLIVYCARVSNPENQSNTLTSKKLIKYLIDNKHWSPFEMANVCLEIKISRDIARQILRHRSFSFQEFSQRYASVDDEFVIKEARLQDLKNRQNSFESDDGQLNDWFLKEQLKVLSCARDVYEMALDKGIAKEVARCVLPEGNTPSVLYMNGSIRSWIHYLQVRLDNGTQKEHRLIAREIQSVLSIVFPAIMDI